ncbi:c-type cytochrome [Salinimicrobium soli]|uniref:c-type cytochrome n=1 Tax=Salinimicrobium soli TaxID=1254399 RepID=UPI003AAACD34
MRKNLKIRTYGVLKRAFFPVLFLVLSSSFFTSCKKEGYAKVPDESAKEELAAIQQEDLVKRGKYLVASIGCGDCHSPKRMGKMGPEEVPELKLSGYQEDGKLPPMDHANLKNGWVLFNPDLTAAVGPWGVSFAANITSDETGIGNWSLKQFTTAMRKGKFKGMENGRDLLPPMPWPNFANLTDKDLEAIYKYLKSTKPVENVVPAPISPEKLAGLK